MKTKTNKRLPHHRVYARLAVSDIQGVGVKAIRTIKKGQSVFHGDDDRSQWISTQSVGHLPKRIQELYEDFTIESGGYYGCPISFNRLTPACYINHSVKPNVAFDRKRGFYALRDIKTGEELTVDYRTFQKLYEPNLTTNKKGR